MSYAQIGILKERENNKESPALSRAFHVYDVTVKVLTRKGLPNPAKTAYPFKTSYIYLLIRLIQGEGTLPVAVLQRYWTLWLRLDDVLVLGRCGMDAEVPYG